MVPRSEVELRVAPRNLRWEVSTNGVTRRLIDWLFSRERAVAHALELAEELAKGGSDVRVVLVVMRADGTEESRETLSLPARGVRVA